MEYLTLFMALWSMCLGLAGKHMTGPFRSKLTTFGFNLIIAISFGCITGLSGRIMGFTRPGTWGVGDVTLTQIFIVFIVTYYIFSSDHHDERLRKAHLKRQGKAKTPGDPS